VQQEQQKEIWAAMENKTYERTSDWRFFVIFNPTKKRSEAAMGNKTYERCGVTSIVSTAMIWRG
jgi:hypothetical protein